MKKIISENWIETLFRDIGMFSGGGTPSTMNPSYWKGSIQWTTSKRLGDSLYLDSGERTISDNALKENSTTLIPKGNLLGGTRVGTGKIVVNRIDIAISQDLTGVIVDKSKYFPEFIAYQTREQRLQECFRKQKRGVTIQGISRDDLKDFVLYVPPLDEQKKIAAVLFKIQQAIEIQESIIEQTRELKKSTLHHVFTHGLHGEKLKETEIGPMPESWDMGTIEDLCLLRNESCNPITCDSRVYVGLEHIESGRFLLRNHGSPKEVRSTKNKFNQYDILYGKLRPYLDKVVVAEVDGICSTDILVLKPKGSTAIFFLIGLLHSDRFIQYANQTTRGVNHPRTSWTSLKDFPAPIPSSEEQKEIDHVFHAIEQKIDIHIAKKSTLQDLLKTMLNKLMTGEIRVKDLDIDVSKVSP